MNATLTDNARAAHNALTTLRRLGVEPPKLVAKAEKDAKAASAKLTDLHTTAGGFTDLLADHLAGRALDPDRVTEVLMACALATRPVDEQAITRSLAAPVAAAIREHGAGMVEAARPVFDRAAEVITAARGVLGDTPLTDLEAVTAIGGDAAQHWKDAKAAEQTITTVTTLLLQLGTAGGYPASADRQQRLLAIVDLDLTGYRRVTPESTPWQLTQHGTLSLATPEQFTARVDAIARAWSEHPDNPATRIPAGVGQIPQAAEMIGGAL